MLRQPGMPMSAQSEYEALRLRQADAIKIADQQRRRALLEVLVHLTLQESRPGDTNSVAVPDRMKAELPEMLRDVA